MFPKEPPPHAVSYGVSSVNSIPGIHVGLRILMPLSPGPALHSQFSSPEWMLWSPPDA